MIPTIISIQHDVIDFSIKPEPKDFKKEGIRHVRTILRRHMPEQKEIIFNGVSHALKYEITFTAKQVLNFKDDLSEINCKSIFIFSITKEEPPDDFWCDLVIKAIEGLTYNYGIKIANTYLKGTKLSVPRTMKQDCIKQREIDRKSDSN